MMHSHTTRRRKTWEEAPWRERCGSGAAEIGPADARGGSNDGDTNTGTGVQPREEYQACFRWYTWLLSGSSPGIDCRIFN